MQINDFITVEVLGTLFGCIGLTTMFTELTKTYAGKVVDPKWYSLMWSTILVVAREFFVIKIFTAQAWFMCFVNILVCSAGAIGLFESVVKPVKKRMKNGK